MQTLTREGNALEPLVANWYAATSGVEALPRRERLRRGRTASRSTVLVLLSIRPFLARCAEALMPRPDFGRWHHGHCPICGWEPDFAVITPAGERRLICGRCVGAVELRRRSPARSAPTTTAR